MAIRITTIRQFILTVLIGSSALSVGAQAVLRKKAASAPKSSYLHIGNVVPDINFVASHTKRGIINLRHMSKKLILLDLWGTYCGSCIEHMPDMVKLQEKFADQVQVIMVTRNSVKEVAALASRSENVRNNPLPFINGKESLSRFFDYAFLPTHVWIDSTGKVAYITDDSRATPENIEAFLKGKPLNFVEKQTIKVGLTNDPLLIQMYPYFKDNFYFYSYLAPRDETKYITGGIQKLGLDRPGNSKAVSGNSFSFQDLYRMAYGFSRLHPIATNRILVNFNDTAGYNQSDRKYVYELVVHRQISPSAIRRYIQSELDLFFNVKSTLEKRMVKCYVISLLPGGLRNQDNGEMKNYFHTVNHTELQVSLSWGDFAKDIDYLYFQAPAHVLDETGLNKELIVNLDLNVDFNDFKAVQGSFAKYGLSINEESREMDCILISDN